MSWWTHWLQCSFVYVFETWVSSVLDLYKCNGCYVMAILYQYWLYSQIASLYSEKSRARSILVYNRNCRHQNWVQFALYINSDWRSLVVLQLWIKNRCNNTGYYSIFQPSLSLLLNNSQYNRNNTIYSVSVHISALLDTNIRNIPSVSFSHSYFPFQFSRSFVY